MGRLLAVGRAPARLLSLPGREAFVAILPRGLALPWLFEPPTAEDGLGPALRRFATFGRLLPLPPALLFPAAGRGAAATGPRGAALEGRDPTLEEGLGLLVALGLLAIFEEGLGPLEGPFALFWLLEVLAAVRGVGAERFAAGRCGVGRFAVERCGAERFAAGRCCGAARFAVGRCG